MGSHTSHHNHIITFNKPPQLIPMGRNRTLWNIFVSFFFLTALLIVLSMTWENAEGKTITVDDDGEADHRSIQEAINSARDGDTILVLEGRYFENVVVNRTVTLTGNDSANTIIDGERKDDVVLINVDGVSMSHFTVTASGGYSNKDGIVVESDDNEIFDNVAVNNANGLYVFGAGGNSIHDNTLTDNDYGIQVVGGSDGNVLSDNNCTGNRKSDIIIRSSEENRVSENYCDSGSLYLVDADHNTIIDNILKRGVLLERSRHNTIESNNCSSNSDDGILVSEFCRYNTIVGNTCSFNGGSGIRVHQSPFNTIEDNSCFSNKEYGIYVSDTRDTTLSGNDCDENSNADIVLSTSTHLTLTDNRMLGNGFFITDGALEHWNTHTIDSSNTVHEKPIYYYKDSSGLTVPSGAGQVILANCTWMTVEQQNCSNVVLGIGVVHSSNITLEDNVCSWSGNAGISLQHSSHVTLTGNSCSNSSRGISLQNVSHATLKNNILTSNTDHAIYLSSSSHSTLTGNRIVEGGIFFDDPSEAGLVGWNTHSIDITNTVNDKPVYYYNDSSGVIVPSGAGQVILANCTGMVVENQECDDTSTGITVAYSSNVTITNTSCRSNRYHGVHLLYSDYNSLTDITCPGNGEYGIYLRSSSYNTIMNATCKNNAQGIALHFANHSTLLGTLSNSNNESGISLLQSSDSIVEHGIYFGNGNGTSLDSGSSSNTFTNNTFSSNSNAGIYLHSGSSSNTFTNNTISGNIIGIYLYDRCENNAAHRNNIFGNSEYGILFTNWNDYHIDATYNWWDDESGPYHNENNPGGKGDNVSDYVDFWNWLEHPLDAIVPTIASTMPVDESSAVPVNTVIRIRFQFQMDEIFVKEAIAVFPHFDYSVSWEENTLTLSPRKNLQYSTKYTISIEKEARTIEGWRMEGAFVFTFTTEEEDVNPEIFFNWPEDGDEHVPVDPVITLMFSEPMDTRSVEDSVEADFEFELMWDSEETETTLYILPKEQLRFETEYFYGFSLNPSDLGGKYLIGWRDVSFTTEALFVNIFEPGQWAKVSGNITISGNATPLADTVEIENDGKWEAVDYFLHGHEGGQHRSGVWGFNLSTWELENGEHNFQLRCLSGDQFSELRQLVIIVANNEPPQITSFELNKKSYKKGETISLTATIFDPNGIDTVETLTLVLRNQSGRVIDNHPLSLPGGGVLIYNYQLPGDLEEETHQLVLVVKDSSGGEDEGMVEFGVGEKSEEDGSFEIAGINGYVVVGGAACLVVVVGVVMVFVVLPKLQEDEEDEEDEDEDKGKAVRTRRSRDTVHAKTTKKTKPGAAPATAKKTTTPRTVTCPRCGELAPFVPERERYKCDTCNVYIKATIKKVAKTQQTRPKAMCPSCHQIGVYSTENKCYYCKICDSYFGGP